MSSTSSGGGGNGVAYAVGGGVGLLALGLMWKSSSDAARAAEQRAEDLKEELAEQREALRDIKAGGGGQPPQQQRPSSPLGPLVDFVLPFLGF